MKNIVFRARNADKEYLWQCAQRMETTISAIMRRLIHIYQHNEDLRQMVKKEVKLNECK